MDRKRPTDPIAPLVSGLAAPPGLVVGFPRGAGASEVAAMTGQHAYSPYTWLMLASPAILLVLVFHAWRHRSAPAARPFALQVTSLLLWALGATVESVAVDPATKAWWNTFQGLWPLPAVTGALWFALEYANLGRWLSRRALALLATPPVVAAILLVTNPSHHLVCRGDSLEVPPGCTLGPLGRILLAYGLLLAVVSSLVFLWLLVRSPLHRWPAALCLCAHASPLGPLDATILGSTFTAVMYAVALVRFRMFELIPVARGTVFEQMQEGVLVLDRMQRVVDLNPAARRILGALAERVRGRPAQDVLPSLEDASASRAEPQAPTEVTLGEPGATRHYELRLSLLEHRGGFLLGYLAVLHDVTERREAQARLVEQQRALATLQERDRVARELHDGLGQVLGYAKMQAQAARERLARGAWREADEHLAQLAVAAQDAHADVREFLLGTRAAGSAEVAFLPSLEDYLRRFQTAYGLCTTLEASTDVAGRAIEPMVGAQLLRIIQETLTNVRKHARASAVRISLSLTDGKAEAVVQDDGEGFDPARLEAAEASTFGLRFMRERAREVGGTVEVRSAPGEGTRVVITVPVQWRVA
jgi:PAS domain S-box-containing protein